MQTKKLLSLLFAVLLMLSAFVGCGKQNDASTSGESTSAQSQSSENTAEEKAGKLFADLKGSYKELWPTILDEKYENVWLSNCAELVGEDKAKESFEMLVSFINGEVYGEEAVKAYSGKEAGSYFCGFTQNLAKLEICENSVIKGYDKDGKELFSHTYHYVGNVDGRFTMYAFKTDDENAGEFTYFYFAPDTPESTYHIEFRYGSDQAELEKFEEGSYAYWMASGIAENCDETMIQNCIKLFCTENLSGEETE
ncbi:MAG: hypothetical protein Q4D20_08175 [Clostridia bacterium]|nr:hypothetical protein [Clostridia bacterium]